MRSCALCACLALAGRCPCGSSGASDARFLSIATGGTGGVYYPYGGGLAKILNEGLPGVRATAEVTAASVDNLKLIRDGRADIAFTLADTLAERSRAAARSPARAGAGREPRGALLQLHAHRHARRSSGIRGDRRSARQGRVDWFAGQRHRGDRRSRLLQAAGLDPDATSRGRGSA